MSNKASILLKHLFSICLCCFTSNAIAQSEGNGLPAHLKSISTDMGCLDVKLIDHPFPDSGPFSYGYLHGDPKSSAVFWCKFEQSPTPMLVIWTEGSTDISCPSKFEWRESLGGLKTDARSVTGTFRNVNDKSIVVAVDKEYGPVIWSTNDGAGFQFLCYQGEWIYRFVH